MTETDTPWRLGTEMLTPAGYRAIETEAHDGILVYGDELAAQIIREHNASDDLLAALRTIEQVADTSEDHRVDCGYEFCSWPVGKSRPCIRHAARAAIAKAEAPGDSGPAQRKEG